MTTLDRGYPFVYKGIEIYSGGANEEDLRHGIQQMRYATPAYLRRSLEFLSDSHPEDWRPLFFSKILVTNAPLRLLTSEVSIDQIRAASSFDDISDPVNTVVLYSDYGPDYEDHFRLTFKQGLDGWAAIARDVADGLRAQGKEFDRFGDPGRLAENLGSANRYECHQVSTQFFVTTLDALPKLLQSIKAACEASFELRAKRAKRSEDVRGRAVHKKVPSQDEKKLTGIQQEHLLLRRGARGSLGVTPRERSKREGIGQDPVHFAACS